jgi:hypothetical protein
MTAVITALLLTGSACELLAASGRIDIQVNDGSTGYGVPATIKLEANERSLGTDKHGRLRLKLSLVNIVLRFQLIIHLYQATFPFNQGKPCLSSVINSEVRPRGVER